jgi:glycosyltransferase involved in cell wall biosynthesis
VAILTPGPVAGFEPDWDRVRIVPPDEGFRLSAELPALAYNARMLPQAVELLRTWRADLVYHRHALGCFAAAAAAGRCGLPLVVEFNGSETWIARKWGEGLRHLGLFEEVERRALRAADLVVAVSKPLLAQLGEMGVPPERVLVNPNGVDPDRFSGDALAERARWHRERLHLDTNEILVGFVGTFGPWHGAEILAEAAARVENATARRLRYVFIGDGPRRAATERRLREAGLADRAAFVGLVPQEETPGLLVACDICASPHVPNEDGSAFFGSPTKLFEYMAGGRAIVASRLDQIAEVLEHERNALLVPPSDPAALARGLERLAADAPLRERLGRTARQDAIRKHSWKHHVERILERLAAPAVPTASTR